jgi:hypothetical protein
MLDNLRESASQSPFFQEEQKPPEQKPPSRRPKGGSGHFLGMTAFQRFFIAIMLFILVCMIGSFVLLATQKIWLGG